MNRSQKLLPVLFTAMVALLAPKPVFSQIQWFTDMQKAVGFAEQTGKPLFVYVFSPGVADCERFQNMTLRHPNVVRMLSQNFVSVALNAQTNRAVAQQYGVYRVPTIMILDSGGTEFKRLMTFYPPNSLISVLQGLEVYSPQAAKQNSIYPNAIFYESFDELHGWGNDESTEGALGLITLVPGVRGNAFRLQYQLSTQEHNWVQLVRELEPEEHFRLPSEYTIAFRMAGSGGHNHVTLKFIDADGTNHGIIMAIPIDYQGHLYALTPDYIDYLWGGEDKDLGEVVAIQIAITPYHGHWEIHGPEPVGEIFVDEFVIVPGIHQIQGAHDPWNRPVGSRQ